MLRYAWGSICSLYSPWHSTCQRTSSMTRFVLLADKKFVVDMFDSQTTNPAAIMRLLYYPPQTGTVDNRVLGIGAHTEYVISSVRVVSMLITLHATATKQVHPICH